MQISDNVRPGAMEAVWALVGIAGPGQPIRKVIIGGAQVLVGRWDDTDVRLDFRGVSKQHAYITRKNGQLFVQDLGSTNGTFVNGRRITAETPLRPGDVVQFGNAPFQVTRDDLSAPDQTQAELVVDRAMALLQFDRLISQRAVTPHFQPIVRVSDQQTIAFEVLARSRVVGLETAKDMFDAASYVQQEVELSQLLREEGVRCCESLPDIPVLFMNTHPLELSDDSLVQSLRDLRSANSQLQLVLEIHEAGITDPDRMSALHMELKNLNIKLAYDDFGAGQARLLELVEVPPDFLKFDLRLIRSIHTAPPQRQGMLASLVQMVADMGIAPLAEGVECAEEAATCRELGFQYAQGYFYGRPAEAGKWKLKG